MVDNDRLWGDWLQARYDEAGERKVLVGRLKKALEANGRFVEEATLLPYFSQLKKLSWAKRWLGKRERLLALAETLATADDTGPTSSGLLAALEDAEAGRLAQVRRVLWHPAFREVKPEVVEIEASIDWERLDQLAARDPAEGGRVTVRIVGPSGSGRRTAARQIQGRFPQFFKDIEILDDVPPGQPRDVLDVRIRAWGPVEIRALLDKLDAAHILDSTALARCHELEQQLTREPELLGPAPGPASVIPVLAEAAAGRAPRTGSEFRAVRTRAAWSAATAARPDGILPLHDETLMEGFWARRFDASVDAAGKPAPRDAVLEALDRTLRESGTRLVPAGRPLDQILEGLSRAKGGPQRQELLDALRQNLRERAEPLLEEMIQASLLVQEDGGIRAGDRDCALFWAARGLAARKRLYFGGNWGRMAEPGWPAFLRELAVAGIDLDGMIVALEGCPEEWELDRAWTLVTFGACAPEPAPRHHAALANAWATALWAALQGAFEVDVRLLATDGGPDHPRRRLHADLARVSERWRGFLPVLDGPDFAASLRRRLPEGVEARCAVWRETSDESSWGPDAVREGRSAVVRGYEWRDEKAVLKALCRLAPAQVVPMDPASLEAVDDDASLNRLAELANLGNGSAQALLEGSGVTLALRFPGPFVFPVPEDEATFAFWKRLPWADRMRWLGRTVQDPSAWGRFLELYHRRPRPLGDGMKLTLDCLSRLHSGAAADIRPWLTRAAALAPSVGAYEAERAHALEMATHLGEDDVLAAFLGLPGQWLDERRNLSNDPSDSLPRSRTARPSDSEGNDLAALVDMALQAATALGSRDAGAALESIWRKGPFDLSLLADLSPMPDAAIGGSPADAPRIWVQARVRAAQELTALDRNGPLEEWLAYAGTGQSGQDGTLDSWGGTVRSDPRLLDRAWRLAGDEVRPVLLEAAGRQDSPPNWFFQDVSMVEAPLLRLYAQRFASDPRIDPILQKLVSDATTLPEAAFWALLLRQLTDNPDAFDDQVRRWAVEDTDPFGDEPDFLEVGGVWVGGWAHLLAGLESAVERKLPWASDAVLQVWAKARQTYGRRSRRDRHLHDFRPPRVTLPEVHPWRNAEVLARCIERLERRDLLLDAHRQDRLAPDEPHFGRYVLQGSWLHNAPVDELFQALEQAGEDEGTIFWELFDRGEVARIADWADRRMETTDPWSGVAPQDSPWNLYLIALLLTRPERVRSHLEARWRKHPDGRRDLLLLAAEARRFLGTNHPEIETFLRDKTLQASGAPSRPRTPEHTE